jgi:thiol:disulfide interchange protein
MKKAFLFLLASLMAISLVLGAQVGAGSNTNQSGQGTGNGTQSNTETQTQNQGNDTGLQNQVQVQTGAYMNQAGEQMQIQSGEGNEVKLQSGNVEAKTTMNMTQEQVQNRTKLQVKLSNGLNAEVKVMPNTASETALARLGAKCEQNNCTIELKEVGTGNQIRAAYEIKTQKQVKVLGLFKAQMKVQAQVDAENGEVIQSKKPWWAFLAAESE